MTDTSQAGKTVALPGPAEVEAEIVEGVVVDDDAPVATSAPLRVVQVVRVVAQHDHTRTAGRHLAYVPIGASVVAKRLWDSRTTARYERFMRAAEASGNHEAALEWDDRMQRFRKDRHERRVDMIKVPVDVLLAVPKVALGLVLVLAVMGIFLGIATKHIAEVAAPFEVVAHIVEWVAIAFSVAWGPVVLALPWIAAGALWHTGRGYANAGSGWLAAKKDDDADTGLVVTADTIVLALQNLQIPALRKAFKEGWKPTFHTLPVRDGRGYTTVYSLPLGVTAAMIADQRHVLARNVHRSEIEVWPSDAERAGVGPAGTVATWIADTGVLSKPAPNTRCCMRAVPTCSRAFQVACRPGVTRSPFPWSGTTPCAAAKWGKESRTPAA